MTTITKKEMDDHHIPTNQKKLVFFRGHTWSKWLKLGQISSCFIHSKTVRVSSPYYLVVKRNNATYGKFWQDNKH